MAPMSCRLGGVHGIDDVLPHAVALLTIWAVMMLAFPMRTLLRT